MVKVQPEGNPAVVPTTRLDPFAAPPHGRTPGGQVETAAALPATLDLDERAVYEVVRNQSRSARPRPPRAVRSDHPIL